jgi:ribosomal protein S18 acetylase RimI-like enzyme
MRPFAADLHWRERVSASDVGRVSSLVEATGFFSREEREVAIELVDERLEKGEASGYAFLFAEGEEELLGYACYGRTPGTVSSYDLYWIVVSPSHQGSGVGSCLLTEVESRIRGAGGTQIWIDTSGRAQYAPTRAFYRKRGYRQEARLSDFYAPGDDKLILVKRLAVVS